MVDLEPWPPDYRTIYLHKDKAFNFARADPEQANAYYSKRPIDFIQDWVFTVDPRNSGTSTPTTVPFCLFERQKDFVRFLEDCIINQCSGLVEKCRDTGATWTSVGFAVWLWRYRAGSSVGFGSRKEMLVDRLGDMDSIFEKIRFTIRKLPGFMLPAGFVYKEHATSMKLINPEIDSSITGEGGDNIGRGGRKLIYFKDESAHYERPRGIESALMDNTNVQIDISSVNGTGNVFYRRRQNGEVWHGEVDDDTKVQIFIFDWRDHPLKTQEWYNRRKAKAIADGLLAEFSQEVDRDYSASILGVVIPAAWVMAAVGLAEDFELDVSGKLRAAMDVADDGISGDKNAIAIAKGLELIFAVSWGQIDTSESANKSVGFCKEFGVLDFQYDSIGVGAGVKGELNQMRKRDELPEGFDVTPWIASGKVVDPYEFVVRGDIDGKGIKNKDFFQNFKAQAWWGVRKRFYEAWKCRQGKDFDRDGWVSISRSIPETIIQEIVAEVSQPTRKESQAGKMLIDKSPNGSSSPNIGDAIIMVLNPAQSQATTVEGISL